MASEGLHEDASLLRPETVERHRAWVSLREELEAIDWYDQRIDATTDEQLKTILAHNRDEEKEHAAMLIAWLACSGMKHSIPATAISQLVIAT